MFRVKAMVYTKRCFTQKPCYAQKSCFTQKLYSSKACASAVYGKQDSSFRGGRRNTPKAVNYIRIHNMYIYKYTYNIIYIYIQYIYIHIIYIIVLTAPWLMTFSEPGFTRSDLCPGSDGGPQELLTFQISSNLFKSSQHWSLMKFVLQQFASWFAWQFASQFASLRCVPMCAGFAMLQHLANRSELHSGCLTASCTQSPSEPRRVAKDLGFTVAGHMCLKPVQHHWLDPSKAGNKSKFQQSLLHSLLAAPHPSHTRNIFCKWKWEGTRFQRHRYRYHNI